ncbi:MAG: potassium channel protein [Euzebyales bacterium]|nr:potassium channel protein [Euzebyales bacterium]MBA3622070.1 potassium channel protein [Euzebyales bacterium]
MPATRRLTAALVSFVLVVCGGTVSYVAITDAGWLDALYMTVISVFTVGFSETFPLGTDGRVVTMAVIVLGVASLGFATAAVVEFLVEGHLQDLLGRRRMDRQLAKLDGHTIVCGFGRVGRQVADQLAVEGRPVVVVDVAAERLQLARERGVTWVEGDASHEDVLVLAGLPRAAGVVACTADDAENILIALTAKGLHSRLFVVVRIKDEENEGKARRAGADRVIAPAAIGGRRIAALMTRPHVVDFLDVVTHGTDVDLVLEEVVVGQGSPLAGAALREADVRQRYGANVLAMRQVNEPVLRTRSDPGHVLCAGDLVVVIGSRDDLDRLQSDSR